MAVSWVYRVIIDEKPAEPPSTFQDHDEEHWLTRDDLWQRYGTQRWATRRYLDLGAARGIVVIHTSNGVRAHIERAPIGPWEEL